MTVFWDTETRSKVGIHEGLDRYAREAECTLLTWCVDDGPVKLHDFTEDRTVPPEFDALLSDPTQLFVAHNSSFDFATLTFALHRSLPIERTRCTRAQAYSAGLPGSLDLLGRVLGLSVGERKVANGKDLIALFCVPRADGGYNDASTHPVEWAAFREYAVRDTAALREVYKRLPTHNFTGDAVRWFTLDQLVNWRGFRFDKPLAIAARHLLQLAKDKHGDEMLAATEGAVSAATQRGRLLAYLNRRYAAELPNLRAATVREMLDQDDLEPSLRWLLECRLEAAKSSGAKYGRGLTLVGPQDRLRFTHQCFGAGRTGRDSHKGFQPGNMARQSMKSRYISDVVIPAILDESALDSAELVGGPNTACANALRGSIIAAPGNELVDADFSNIESRVAAWLAVQADMLARYRAGDDLYRLWYAERFAIAPEDVTDEQRQIAKVVFLSMQFLGGVGAFVPMAATYNLDLDTLPDIVLPTTPEPMLAKAERAWGRALLKDEDFELEPPVYMACDVLKQAYRTQNANIFRTGYEVGNAVLSAIKEPGKGFEVAKCLVWSTGSVLIIQLPDGDRLTYFNPRVDSEKEVDPLTGEESWHESSSYMTSRNKSWRRESAWAGLYWENIVQAIANRLLRAAALRIHADTLTVPAIAAYLDKLPAHARTAIVLRVHDSLTLDVPKDSYPVERMIQQMNILPKWAAGLPVATEAWANTRFGKWK